MPTTIPRIALMMVFAMTATAVDAGDTQSVVDLSFDGQNGPVEITLDSAETGFHLTDLETGESRLAVSSQGEQVLVTRLESGVALDINGERFEVPLPSADSDAAASGEVRIMREEMDLESDAGGLMIFSMQHLDEATQQAIRDAIASAGVNMPVRFHDAGTDGKGKVVVRKEIHGDGDSIEKKVIVRKRVRSGT